MISHGAVEGHRDTVAAAGGPAISRTSRDRISGRVNRGQALLCARPRSDALIGFHGLAIRPYGRRYVRPNPVQQLVDPRVLGRPEGLTFWGENGGGGQLKV